MKYSFFSLYFYLSILLGWILLIAHVLNTPFKFEFKWILFYLVAMVMAVMVSQILMWSYSAILKKEVSSHLKFWNRDAPRKIPWFIQTPGEDGIVLVPLLYIGINPISAAIVALLFFFLHIRNYSIDACIPKGIFMFIVALFILPKSGIFPLIVGHWLLDGLAFYLFPQLFKFKHYPYKTYYENGALKEEGYCSSDNKREGEIKCYFPSGKLQSKGDYKNGEADGLWIGYDEQGIKTEGATYANGQLHGFHKQYYPDGTLNWEATYENGLREGFNKKYYSNGIMQSEVHFSKEKQDGIAKWYYKNGSLEKEGTYKDGEIQGRFKWFNEDGTLDSEADYKDDVLIEEDKA